MTVPSIRGAASSDSIHIRRRPLRTIGIDEGHHVVHAESDSTRGARGLVLIAKPLREAREAHTRRAKAITAVLQNTRKGPW